MAHAVFHKASSTLDHAFDAVPPWKSMSFSCGGWLQFYMFGVARALQAKGLDSPSTVKYCGCSAGALAAAGLAFEGDFDAAIDFCKNVCVPNAYSKLSGLFCLDDYVSRCIDMQLEAAFKPIPKDSLQIAVTKLPFFEAQRDVEFKTFQDLKLSLLSSAAAYPAAPVVYKDGAWYIDGGLSDFQPIIDTETITVSPFYFSDCDIKPSRYVPFWWAALPPKSEHTIDWLYNLGYEDCLEYLRSVGLVPSMHRTTSEKFLSNLADDGNKIFRDENHPYDIRRRVSVHRLLGYDLCDVPAPGISGFLQVVFDSALLLFTVVVWKPFALLLIYAEVILKIAYLIFATLLCDIAESLNIVFLFFASRVMWIAYQKSFLLLREVCKDLYFVDLLIALYVGTVTKLLLRGTSHYNRVASIRECFRSIWSLSLLGRFLSGTPSSNRLRKNDILYKHSILYRIFRHIL